MILSFKETEGACLWVESNAPSSSGEVRESLSPTAPGPARLLSVAPLEGPPSDEIKRILPAIPHPQCIHWVQVSQWASPPHTQDGHHDITPQDLDGAPGDEVEGSKQIPSVDQCVPWWCMCGLELHGQGPQAAFSGPTERFAVLQQGAVEV